jgi:hypothetical protein
MAPQQQPITPQPEHVLASTVLVVIMRVAGPVITDVRPHALGTPEQQVIVRIGDALIYLTDPQLTARIRQQWDAAQYLVSQRLPERVSQTWLVPEPGTYPVGVSVQLTGEAKVTTQSVAAHLPSRTPAHLRMSVDRRLVWQVCDRQSWRAIGEAWFAAQRYLQR